MAITVVCPGCKKRFDVSDKFAGKKGPCPKCKAEITVPTKDESVVIHAPEYGPKDASGRAVLKPLARTETRFSTLAVAGVVMAILSVLVLAVVLRYGVSNKENFPVAILATGALLLGPPLAAAGYSFLRDDELEPYRGQSLLVRSTICGLVYAALWAMYALIPKYVLQLDRLEELEVFQLLFLVPPLVIVGGLTAVACFELDFGSGMLDYGLYLLVTVVLCFIIGVPLF